MVGGTSPTVTALRRAQAAAAAIEQVAVLIAVPDVSIAATLSTASEPTPPMPHPGDGAPLATLPPGCFGGGDAVRDAVASGAVLALGPLTLFFAFHGGMVASFSDVDFRSLLQSNSLSGPHGRRQLS